MKTTESPINHLHQNGRTTPTLYTSHPNPSREPQGPTSSPSIPSSSHLAADPLGPSQSPLPSPPSPDPPANCRHDAPFSVHDPQPRAFPTRDQSRGEMAACPLGTCGGCLSQTMPCTPLRCCGKAYRAASSLGLEMADLAWGWVVFPRLWGGGSSRGIDGGGGRSGHVV